MLIGGKCIFFYNYIKQTPTESNENSKKDIWVN